MSVWYFVRDGRRVGPVSAAFIVDELRRERLNHNDLAWSESLAGWQPIGEVPEILELAKLTPPPMPVEEPRVVQRAPLPQVPTLAREPFKASKQSTAAALVGYRALALLFDGAVLFLPGMVLMYIIAAVLYTVEGTFDPEKDRERFQLIFQLAATPLLWVYNVAFECSRLQATPGKMFVGLRVTGENGERLTLGRSTLRFLVKNFTLPIGFVLAFMEPRRQSLHDMVAKTHVAPERP